MKTSEITGATLDYWVAKAVATDGGVAESIYGRAMIIGGVCMDGSLKDFRPSSKWAHGGPIIERERIEMRPESNGQWLGIAMVGSEAYGSTALIAAMRAYVASKFGSELPDKIT